MPKVFDLLDHQKCSDKDREKIQSYINRYTKERYNHIIKYITDDAKSVHLSRSLMNEFFEKNSTADGMRVHYSVIDDPNEGFQQGVHNLIFIPTKLIDGKYVDMLGDNDWVIVTQNINSDSSHIPDTFICPPGKPCRS